MLWIVPWSIFFKGFETATTHTTDDPVLEIDDTVTPSPGADETKWFLGVLPAQYFWIVLHDLAIQEGLT
jgi:hypothetical protein